MSCSRTILSHYHYQNLQSTLHLYSNNTSKNHHVFFGPKQSLSSSPSLIVKHPITTSFPAASSSLSASNNKSFRFLSNNNADDFRYPFVHCLHPSQKGSSPLSDSLSGSENGDYEERPPERLSSIAGGVVALGKFDALHIGHRELAIKASKVGVPFLLSFHGMAEVLGWEPRAPIVAKYDRKRILSSWAPHCGNLTPREFQIEFSKVRNLTPQQFVEKLSLELGVCGVVAGENYRFGYKAAGNASDLVKLCAEYGMRAYIISSVMDKKQDSKKINSSDLKEQGQVSSTRVRHALAEGDMKYVSELLGRHHRLMLMIRDEEVVISDNRVSAPKSCLLNLQPREGSYENCSLLVGDKNVVACRVTIDTTHIHLDLDNCTHFISQDCHLLGIEFGSGSF